MQAHQPKPNRRLAHFRHLVELIDHAVSKHGKKVKFLTFREALERLNRHLLAGQPLRHPEDGTDNGVRLLDLDNVGYLDVVIGNDTVKKTRVWSPAERRWRETSFPCALVDTLKENQKVVRYEAYHHFGVLRRDGKPSLLNDHSLAHEVGWHFDGTGWVDKALDTAPLTGSGQMLPMAMYHADHTNGSDEMINRVAVFDPP